MLNTQIWLHNIMSHYHGHIELIFPLNNDKTIPHFRGTSPNPIPVCFFRPLSLG